MSREQWISRVKYTLHTLYTEWFTPIFSFDYEFVQILIFKIVKYTSNSRDFFVLLKEYYLGNCLTSLRIKKSDNNRTALEFKKGF